VLDLDCYFIKGVLVVKMRGSLNSDTINKFNKAASNLFEYGFTNTLFNLNDIYEIDLNGYKTLLSNCKKIERSGRRALFFGIDKKMFDSNNEYNIHDDINVLNYFNI
jgi:anti-anti-sigma regulatory factor